MAYIVIRAKDGALQVRTDAYYSIYDYLMAKGYTHEEAEDVACWSEIASIGDSYELDGVDIEIAE